MSHRPSLLEPSRLAPVHVDLRRVFLAGMALWAVGLAVAAVLVARGTGSVDAAWVCAVGFALGFVALAWEARRRP